MSTYLVTGGAGFIGSHLVDALLANKHEVVVLDDLSSGKVENLSKETKFVRGSVTDTALVCEVISGCDGCFHLAAIASVERSNNEWLTTHQVNLTGSISILNAAAKSKIPVVYASSAAVYGNASEFPTSETAPVQPSSAYGSDKRGIELHAQVGWNVHGIPSIGLRLFNVYGPRQSADSSYSGVISTFVDRLDAGQGITIFGDGRQTRDFVYVGDVVDVMRAAMGNASQDAKIFNVCTGIETSLLQLAEILATTCNVEPVIDFASPRSGDIARSIGDPSLLETELGLRPHTDLTMGLQRMLRQQ